MEKKILNTNFWAFRYAQCMHSMLGATLGREPMRPACIRACPYKNKTRKRAKAA
jgi:hypothetical protein